MAMKILLVTKYDARRCINGIDRTWTVLAGSPRDYFSVYPRGGREESHERTRVDSERAFPGACEGCARLFHARREMRTSATTITTGY